MRLTGFWDQPSHAARAIRLWRLLCLAVGVVALAWGGPAAAVPVAVNPPVVAGPVVRSFTSGPAANGPLVTHQITGTAIDDNGKPVSGADVDVLTIGLDPRHRVLTLIGHLTTKDDGAFSLANARTDLRSIIIVAVHKTGLAAGWGNIYPWRGDAALDITLAQPGPALTGTVVDEHGQPVAGAEVRVAAVHNAVTTKPAEGGGPIRLGRPEVLLPWDACAWLTMKTDAHGEFTCTVLPADCTTDFIVTAPGKSRVSTISAVVLGRRMSHRPGQPGIRIALAPEARAEGVVTDAGTGKPVPGVTLSLSSSPSDNWFPRGSTAVSDAQGRFQLTGLSAGTFMISLLPGANEDPWVAADMPVTLQAGAAVRDLKFAVSHGDTIEVTVTDAVTGKPVPGAYVNLYAAPAVGPGGVPLPFGVRPVAPNNSVAGNDGAVRFLLSPGEYRVQQVQKYPEYPYDPQQQPVPVTLVAGKTTRVAIKLRPAPQVVGVLRDQNAKPVAGASVQVTFGGSVVQSDAEGRFRITLMMFPSAAGDQPICVVAVDQAHNLAALVELKKTEAAKEMGVVMSPGWSIAGRVTGPDGKPVVGANVRAMAQVRLATIPMNGAPAVTDAQGRYEVTALPPGQAYLVNITAQGFGQRGVALDMPDADSRRIEAGNIHLLSADQSVSGVVVDQNGEPVAEVMVNVYGQGQNPQSARTDKEGKFTIKGLVDGAVQINAWASNGQFQPAQGQFPAGDADIRLVIQRFNNVVVNNGAVVRPPARRRAVPPPAPVPPHASAIREGPRQLRADVVHAGVPAVASATSPLLAKPLPDLKPFDVPADARPAAGKRVLVCFFDIDRPETARAAIELSAKAGKLASRGVAVLLIHAGAGYAPDVATWATRNQVTQPIATIAGERNEVLHAWGVGRQPWLILTDAKRVVRAAGFDLDDLEDNLQAVGR